MWLNKQMKLSDSRYFFLSQVDVNETFLDSLSVIYIRSCHLVRWPQTSSHHHALLTHAVVAQIRSRCAHSGSGRRHCDGWGLLNPLSPLRDFFPVFELSDHWLSAEYHVFNWQLSTQLKRGDNRKYERDLNDLTYVFCQIRFSYTGEIDEWIFSNPQPRRHFYSYRLSLIPAWISNLTHSKVGWNFLSIPGL